jgi:hypothetical protein
MLVIFFKADRFKKRCSFLKKLVTKQVVPQWMLAAEASLPTLFFRRSTDSMNLRVTSACVRQLSIAAAVMHVLAS